MLDDAARKWTDEELEALERRMRREYMQAAREMRGKQAKWLEKFNAEREQREKALDSTKEAMEAHKAWLSSQTARSEWLDGMVNGLSESAHGANVRATDMVNDHIPHVFAGNANRAAFAIEGHVGRDMGFALVNEDAVRYLMGLPLQGGGGGQLVKEVVDEAAKLGPGFAQSVRKREMDYPQDMRWNRQKFTSAITQGILQGESIPDIVKRTESVFGQNMNAAIRAARTATTNAENAGRMSTFERAEKLGIDMEIEWQATLDERTRESHRELDGQRVQLGEYFETENGPIRWPGDPQADPAETWNCRCRADGRVVGFDGERGDWADDAEGERWARLPEGMTYDEWKEAKAVSRGESYANEAGRVPPEWYAANTKSGTAAEGAMLRAALDDYIHGSYEGIVNAANVEIGGFGEFDSVLDEDFVARKGKAAFFTAEEEKRAEAIVEAIEAQEPTSMAVVRTEWRRSAPSEGDELRWGIKSASKDTDFAHKVASGEVEGMNSFMERGLPSDNGDLLVYHVEGAHKQLDISAISDYESQQEVLLHGRFEVVRVTEELYDTGIKTNRAIELTPRQWAEREGLEIEYFTSKKGKPMARFGTRTYPVGQMDTPSSAFASGMETDRVTLRHVYIRRTDM